MSKTKERPILFSGPMVRAILDGRKTQTRRPLAKRDLRVFADELDGPSDIIIKYGAIGHSGPGWYAACADYTEDGSIKLTNLYGEVGDRLWVRETWNKEGGLLTYRADGDWIDHYRREDRDDDAARKARGLRVRWRPSIHMPRWASRLTLAVTSVRVERLQDITEEDARAEGFTEFVTPEEWFASRPTVLGREAIAFPKQPSAALIAEMELENVTHHPASVRVTAAQGFQHAWIDTYGPESWDANPWVWVVGFEVAR